MNRRERRFLAGLALSATLLGINTSGFAEDATNGTVQIKAGDLDPAQWNLCVPKDSTVAYHGVVNYDNAGVGSNPMLYPAPNAAGLLAGILTHGIITDSMKNSQKEKMENAADGILKPYQTILNDFTMSDLMQRTISDAPTDVQAQIISINKDKPQQKVALENAPVFSMTQDQSAIILDNKISIYLPDTPAPYQCTVRIVAPAIDAKDHVAYWTANNGEKLKELSAKLLAESIDMALRYTGNESTTPKYRTVDYKEGTEEKFERAEVLSEQCDHLVLRTLRGTLLSVPVLNSDTASPAANCNTVSASVN